VRFQLGTICATPGALEALDASGETPNHFLARHAAGDWGEVGAADRRANDDALRAGERLLSAYTLTTGVRLWVITEAADDQGARGSTTLLLPEEY
jgi:hypothetical protein